MATVAENLQTTKENLAAKLAAISANPQPSYSVDGISFSWTEYFNMLTTQMKAINELAAQEGPVVLNTEGVS